MSRGVEKVSIVVPVYNVEQYLPKCLDSIINQTYDNIEIILVDDGSADRSVEIVEEYARLDSRVVVIHKKNGGLSDARNAGISVAAGNYLVFIDSDDYVDKKMIETMYLRIVKDQSDMVMCGVIRLEKEGIVKENNSILEGVFTPDEFITSWMQGRLGRYVGITCGKLYKKQLFQKIRFPFGKQHEDAFTAHYLIGESSRISTINMPMYYYVQREDSIMNKPYSVKRLDGAEAMLDRVNYALNCGKNEWAAYALKKAMAYLIEGYRHKIGGGQTSRIKK